jgi:predicted Zn finger-like uncharacterized protein
MLLTRCPECETTFRVTDEALKKASGQVRCGRCASVFNAYAELHDSDKTPESQPAQPTEPVVGRPVAEGAAGSAAAAAAERDEPDSDPGSFSAEEIDQVLTTNVGAGLPRGAPAWPTLVAAVEHRRGNRWWGVAAGLALLALLGQGLHSFRSEIAGHPTFGPWIQQAYGLVGSEITPSWDVHQYEILDSVATQEPNSRGLGSLKITARIQNRGPLHQPYPAVQLHLQDRWEAAVSSRVFTPAEYLPRDSPRGRLMSPGETARAEIEVVDPGPDAAGFELDVCVEVEASLITCRNDKVFSGASQ